MKMNNIHFQYLEKMNQVVHTSAQLLFSHCLMAIYKMHLSRIVRKNKAFKSFGNISDSCSVCAHWQSSLGFFSILL